MTGTVVESRPPGRVGVVLLVVAAGACATAAVAAGKPIAAVVAALPLALAAALRLAAEPPARFEITADGLAFDEPDVGTIRYDDIQGLTAPGRGNKDVFPMQLYHPGGVVRLPARLSVLSRDVYRFVLAQLPDADAPAADIPPALRPFAAEQLELFGPDKVFIFVARPHPPVPGHRRKVACWSAVAVAGAVWVAVGAMSLAGAGAAAEKDGAAWIGAGVVAFLLGLLCAFVFSRQGTAGRVSNWRESGLVIGPGGIALVQGTLRGRMRWDELRAVDYPAKARYGLTTSGGAKHGIGLLVDGAYLIVADYYTRPLARVHSHLRAYWGGRDAN